MREEATTRSEEATATPTRPTEWPSVEELRERCDDAIRAKHGCTRSAALRKVDLAASTFERAIREGINDDTRPRVVKKLRALGVFEIVPRR